VLKNIRENLLVFILYIILFIVQWFLINFFQDLEIAIAASLTYLPHGLRVIAIILVGAKILPGLFLSHVVSGFYIQFTDQLILIEDIIAIILTSIGGTLSAYIAIYLLKLYYEKYPEITIKNILIIALIASIINILTSNLVYNFTYISWEFSSQFILFILGDLIGAIIVFYFLKLIYSLIKKDINI